MRICLHANCFLFVWLVSEDKRLRNNCIPLYSTHPGHHIYTIHRNFVNVVIIEWPRRYIQKDRKWLIPKREWEGIQFRWEVNDKGKKAALPHIKIWGDLIQLLYSSGLAILLGSTLTKIFDTSGKEYKLSWTICIICFCFYVIGFFADIRKQTAETKIEKLIS